jgi:hypothetical protein
VERKIHSEWRDTKQLSGLEGAVEAAPATVRALLSAIDRAAVDSTRSAEDRDTYERVADLLREIGPDRLTRLLWRQYGDRP